MVCRVHDWSDVVFFAFVEKIVNGCAAVSDTIMYMFSLIFLCVRWILATLAPMQLAISLINGRCHRLVGGLV